MLVATDEPPTVQDMPLCGIKNPLLRCAGTNFQAFTQGIEGKTIIVRVTRRRAGATVTDSTEIVFTVQDAVGELEKRWHVFRQSAFIGRQAEKHPVGENANWGIRVIHNENQ